MTKRELLKKLSKVGIDEDISFALLSTKQAGKWTWLLLNPAISKASDPADVVPLVASSIRRDNLNELSWKES